MARLKIKDGGSWYYAGYGPASSDGWVALSACTYEGADAPTFTFSIASDVTGLLAAGMRIKLTQTTVKYFIITAVGAYSGGKTIITVYGGTDYTLANAAITLPYYSMMKIPFGFPQNPEKWMEVATDTTSYNKASPAQNTWYNLLTTKTMPIGAWIVYLNIGSAYVLIGASAGVGAADFALSNTNNSASNVELVLKFQENQMAASDALLVSGAMTTFITVTSKTSMYLNCHTTSAVVSALNLNGSARAFVVRYVCAYL